MWRRALQICRGLTLRETGWLGAALCLGDPEALADHTHPEAPPLVALQRGLHARHPAEMGRAILARLNKALALGLDRVHPGWINQLRGRERPRAIELATKGSPACATPAARATAEWLRHHLGARFGPLDPRHAWEARRAHTLELAGLRLIPTRDLDLLLHHLGMDLLATAMVEAERREIATLARRLGGELSRDFLDRLSAPPALSPTASPLAHLAMAMLGEVTDQNPTERIRRLGLFALARSGGPRRQDTVRGLAHAFSPKWGRWMLGCCAESPPGSSDHLLSDEIAAVALKKLQHISARGLTERAYHPRRALVSPPTARLSDEGDP